MNFSFDVMFAVLAAISNDAVNKSWYASILNDLFGNYNGINWYECKHLKKAVNAAAKRIRPAADGWNADDLRRLRDVFVEEVMKINNLQMPKTDFGFSGKFEEEKAQ